MPRVAAPAREPFLPHPAPAARRRLPTGAVVGIVGGALALVLVLTAVFVSFMVFGGDTIKLTQTGVSMEPTIRAGQSVSATKVDPGKYRPRHGDIVVFDAPVQWVAGGGKSLMKRVIGLPGERLACCDPAGRWTIGGKPLDEPYVKAGGDPDRTPFDVVVPDGRLWVMGDNRAASNDSRTLFIRTADINAATIPVSAVSAIVKG
jgi:signal peptidase I